MTSETLKSIEESPVRVARKHRIRQRLGQLSTGGRFNRQVIAPLARLERRRIPAGDLLSAVISALHTHETNGTASESDKSILVSKYIATMTPKVLPLLQAPERRPVHLESLARRSLVEGQEFPLTPINPAETASDEALQRDLTVLFEAPSELSV